MVTVWPRRMWHCCWSPWPTPWSTPLCSDDLPWTGTMGLGGFDVSTAGVIWSTGLAGSPLCLCAWLARQTVWQSLVVMTWNEVVTVTSSVWKWRRVAAAFYLHTHWRSCNIIKPLKQPRTIYRSQPVMALGTCPAYYTSHNDLMNMAYHAVSDILTVVWTPVNHKAKKICSVKHNASQVAKNIN